MDIGASVREALRERRKNNKWLAKQLNVTISMSYHHTQKRTQSQASIEKLAAIFGLSEAEFIELADLDETHTKPTLGETKHWGG